MLSLYFVIVTFEVFVQKSVVVYRVVNPYGQGKPSFNVLQFFFTFIVTGTLEDE